MPLILSEDQAMIRDAASGFIAAHAPVAHLRALRDGRDPDGLSRDLWRAFGEMGFAGALIPEAHGGAGLGAVEAGVIAEEIGKTLAPTPFLSTAVLAARLLTEIASTERQAELLPGMAAGERLVAVALEEGPKHAPARTAMTAARAGNGFVLNGTKSFVIDGHVADRLIVLARTSGQPGDDEGLTLFLVDPQGSGIAVERTVMVDAHNAARIVFTNVAVDADTVLGEVDGALAPLERALDLGRAVVASEMIGAGGEAFDRTIDYLKTRRQFGRLIGEFQALQHRAAHLHCELEITRAAALAALQALDADTPNAALLVSVAKARAGKAAELAVQEAVQMHGGIGMTDEVDMGLFMKRVRVTQEFLGDADFHADRVARLLGY